MSQQVMHVAMLVRVMPHHSLGGMQLHAEALRQGLTRLGYRVSTITTTSATGPQVTEDRYGRIYYVDSGRPGQYTKAWEEQSVRTLLRIHASDPIAVIMAHGKTVYPYLRARESAATTPWIPVVIVSHGTIVEDVRSHLRELRRYSAPTVARLAVRDVTFWRDDRRWLHKADHVTMLNDRAKQIVCKWFPLDDAAVTVIPNGVDVEAIEAAAPLRHSMRQRLGVAGAEIVVVVVGRLESTHKGHIYLLEAVASAPIRELGAPIRLLFVGEGASRRELEDAARQRGLERRVIFYGAAPHTEVPALLAASDIFALPSVVEGMPLAILEAMAAGLPVIATAVGAVPQVIEDGQTGLLVPPGDAAALAQALRHMLTTPADAARYRTNAWNRVRALYDQRIMVQRYAEVLERTARSTNQPARAIDR